MTTLLKQVNELENQLRHEIKDEEISSSLLKLALLSFNEKIVRELDTHTIFLMRRMIMFSRKNKLYNIPKLKNNVNILRYSLSHTSENILSIEIDEELYLGEFLSEMISIFSETLKYKDVSEIDGIIGSLIFILSKSNLDKDARVKRLIKILKSNHTSKIFNSNILLLNVRDLIDREYRMREVS